MNEVDTPFFCEHSYSCTVEGKRIAARVGMISAYALFVAVFFVTVYYTRLIPLFALCPIALWIAVYFTWPLISYDFYFEFRSGTLTLGKEGRKMRRIKRTPKLTLQVKYAEQISSVPAGRVKLSKVLRCYDFSGTLKSDRRIAIVFEKNNRKCVCILECTVALAKMLRSYSHCRDELGELIERL